MGKRFLQSQFFYKKIPALGNCRTRDKKDPEICRTVPGKNSGYKRIVSKKRSIAPTSKKTGRPPSLHYSSAKKSIGPIDP